MILSGTTNAPYYFLIACLLDNQPVIDQHHQIEKIDDAVAGGLNGAAHCKTTGVGSI
jgi:hypothetical protein